jgi:hypothetical protein
LRVLTDMPVSARLFLRGFARFKRQAEKGETVVIESRDGFKFAFKRIGEMPRPARVRKALPKEITEQWDLDTPGILSDEWEMNR